MRVVSKYQHPLSAIFSDSYEKCRREAEYWNNERPNIYPDADNDEDVSSSSEEYMSEDTHQFTRSSSPMSPAPKKRKIPWQSVNEPFWKENHYLEANALRNAQASTVPSPSIAVSTWRDVASTSTAEQVSTMDTTSMVVRARNSREVDTPTHQYPTCKIKGRNHACAFHEGGVSLESIGHSLCALSSKYSFTT